MIARTLVFLGALALTACAVGPNYHRPAAPVPQTFKEAQGWKPAEPRDAASGTAWWSVYDDSTLDELEKQIDVSNQTLKSSEAAWRQARAGLFPTVGVDATAQRSRGTSIETSSGTTTLTTGLATSQAAHPVNEFNLAGTASWDLD